MVGLINVQFAVAGDEVYVIEANPRASRTVPFVSKATGIPLAKVACRMMLGARWPSSACPRSAPLDHVSVKEAVLPFDRFDGADPLMGPEMRSTGEVMGVAADFPTAFAKAQAAAGTVLPAERHGVHHGHRLRQVRPQRDRRPAPRPRLPHRGHPRHRAAISRMGVPGATLNKLGEGSPHVVDWIERGDVDLVINTPMGTGARADGYEIRRAAVARGIPCVTTLSGGSAAARAIAAARGGRAAEVLSLQELHRAAAGSRAGDMSGAAAPPAAAERRGAAPFGRRRAAVAADRDVGAYRLLACADPDGPRAAAGPVLHAGRGRAVGRRGGRAALPAAGLLATCAAREGQLEFLLEDVGPGTHRLAELAPGDGLWLLGPLGRGFAPPEAGRRALLVGGGIGIVPLAALQDELPARPRAAGVPRRRACRRPPSCSTTPRWPPTTGAAGHRGLVTELLDERLDGDDAAVYACGPPAMLEAVPPVRRAAACRPSSRWRRGWPAGSAPASAAWCPPATATSACASTGRCLTRPRWRPRWCRARDMTRRFCGIELGDPIINGSGTFDAIAALRTFGDALLERFPFTAFVSKTITVEPRQGNPPPRLWETPAGLINSIGLPNKRPARVPGDTTCPSWRGCPSR